MEPETSFATSPASTASNDAYSLHSGARGRGLRSACDFCHKKRIKCVLMEGQSHCQQCKRRHAEECSFSVKLKTGAKAKRSSSKSDTSSRGKRRKTTPGFRLERVDSSAVADSSVPTRPLPTLVASTNPQEGTGYFPGSPGNNVLGKGPTKLGGGVPPCDWNIVGINGRRPWGVQQSMSPSRLSLFSSPAGGVTVGGMASSSALCRPYELHDRKRREGDLGSCYGGGGSSGDVGVDGMAAPCGYFRKDRVWNVDSYFRDEDTLEFILKVQAMLESLDAESVSNAGRRS